MCRHVCANSACVSKRVVTSNILSHSQLEKYPVCCCTVLEETCNMEWGIIMVGGLRESMHFSRKYAPKTIFTSPQWPWPWRRDLNVAQPVTPHVRNLPWKLKFKRYTLFRFRAYGWHNTYRQAVVNALCGLLGEGRIKSASVDLQTARYVI